MEVVFTFAPWEPKPGVSPFVHMVGLSYSDFNTKSLPSSRFSKKKATSVSDWVLPLIKDAWGHGEVTQQSPEHLTVKHGPFSSQVSLGVPLTWSFFSLLFHLPPLLPPPSLLFFLLPSREQGSRFISYLMQGSSTCFSNLSTSPWVGLSRHFPDESGALSGGGILIPTVKGEETYILLQRKIK